MIVLNGEYVKPEEDSDKDNCSSSTAPLVALRRECGMLSYG